MHERTAASPPSLLSSPHCCRNCYRVNASFLCASVLSGDHCLRAPGPESGRSSPYHSQLDVRSSTPTSYQAPKHFHIPGRLPARNSRHGCMLHGAARHPAPAQSRSRFLGTLPTQLPALTHPPALTRLWALVHPLTGPALGRTTRKQPGEVPQTSRGPEGMRQKQG